MRIIYRFLAVIINLTVSSVPSLIRPSSITPYVAQTERRPVHTSYPSPPTARSFRRVVSRPLTTFPSSFRHSVPERTVGEWKGRKEGVEGSRRQDTTRYTSVWQLITSHILASPSPLTTRPARPQAGSLRRTW